MQIAITRAYAFKEKLDNRTESQLSIGGIIIAFFPKRGAQSPDWKSTHASCHNHFILSSKKSSDLTETQLRQVAKARDTWENHRAPPKPSTVPCSRSFLDLSGWKVDKLWDPLSLKIALIVRTRKDSHPSGLGSSETPPENRDCCYPDLLQTKWWTKTTSTPVTFITRQTTKTVVRAKLKKSNHQEKDFGEEYFFLKESELDSKLYIHLIKK